MAFEGNLKCVPGAIAGSNLVGKQFHCTVLGGPYTWALSSSSFPAFVVQDLPVDGGAVQVAYSGVTRVIAGAGGVYVGHVVCDTNGHAVMPKGAGHIFGYALHAAAAGDYVSVLLSVSKCPVSREALACAMNEAASVTGAILVATVPIAGVIGAASAGSAALSRRRPVAGVADGESDNTADLSVQEGG